MRPVLLLAIMMTSTTAVEAQTAQFDAVAVAPKSHRVLMEDEKIRVLRVEVAPGATEPVHDHRWPSVMYFEHPQPITYVAYKLVDGRPVETERVDAPAFEVSQTVRGEPEGLHAVTNRGTKSFVAVRIEFKDQAPAKIDSGKP
jgi:predicted metal-dependent enzyme (double-stranded beta helix superfamily)